MSTRDVPCGQCWCRSGERCINRRTGKPMKTFHSARKDRAKRRGVFGLRSIIKPKD